jgi:glycosidase
MKIIFQVTILLTLLSGCASPSGSPHARALAQATPTEAAASDWWKQAVVYEIFTRSYQDSDNDGIGDLTGIIQRLDYIQSLGADAIWLTPIMPAKTYHGYDTIDFKDVNRTYGSIETMKKLISEAHNRNIKIILDMAVNQTSVFDPWFEQAKANPSSSYRDFYLWNQKPIQYPSVTNSVAHWHALDGEFYYSTFGHDQDRADLNWKNPQVLTEIQSAFDFWTDLGIDGFRLDAAKYLIKGPAGQTDMPGTHEIWQKITQTSKAKKPGTLFVGEVWSDPKTISTYYGGGHELDQCFNFPLAQSIVSSLQAEKATSFYQNIQTMQATFAKETFPAPFLTNHDQIRIATQVGGDLGKLKLGAAILLSLPGTPYIYYGEELGLTNGSGAAFTGDLGKRTPMPWDDTSSTHGFSGNHAPWVGFTTGASVEAEERNPDSLLSEYKNLIRLRHENAALSGDFMRLNRTSDSRTMSYTRSDGKSSIVALFTFAASSQENTRLDLASALPAGTKLELLYGNPGVKWTSLSPTSFNIQNLPGKSAVFFRIVSAN